MKATTAILLTTLSAAVFIGCDQKDSAASGPKADAPKKDAPAAGAPAAPKVAAKPYPLDVCIVSGEKLGSMGEPVVYVHEGQEVKFCCKNCAPDFKKEPQKYLAKLAAKK